MSNNSSYRHVQHAPICVLLYILAIIFLVTGLVLKNEPPIARLFPPIALLVLFLAASFHHLTVEDQINQLSVRFGPIPLFRRAIRYDDITGAEIGRTTILEGWGIHKSIRGGWVWNIWGRDCVVVHFSNGGTLRIGTDDAEQLARFLKGKTNG